MQVYYLSACLAIILGEGNVGILQQLDTDDNQSLGCLLTIAEGGTSTTGCCSLAALTMA